VAFWELTGDRAYGDGFIGKIPFVSIDRYAARLGVEGDEFERFKRLVNALDDAYRTDFAEKMKAKAKR